MSAYLSVQNILRASLSALTEEDKPILVAFSGGADSSLLLHLLCEENRKLLAVHVNHGIRGEEANRDAAFCRELCESLSVPFCQYHLDVPAMAKENGMCIEEAAREARYSILERVAMEQGIPYIATAHHADDNLETILFHMIRGSALKGLCGIPPKRGAIIRPLLSCEKDEILAACRERNIPFVTDSSNADTAYARNYLRAEVIPRLKHLNPKLVSSVSTTASLLIRDEDALTGEALQYSLADGRKRLSELHDAMLSRVLLHEMKQLHIFPTHRNLIGCMDAIRASTARMRVTLPGGILLIDRENVSILREEPRERTFSVPLSRGINILDECSAIYVEWGQDAPEKDINKLKNIYKFAIKATIDSATIEKACIARSRRPQDTIYYGGMTRKVKKLLQSQKTTAAERCRLPLIVNDEAVLWIPGFPVSDRAKPTSPNRTATLIYLYNT